MSSGLKEQKKLVLVSANLVITKLHIKFVLCVNLSQINWNLNLNHNIWLRKGGGKRDWWCKFLHIRSAHNSNLGEIYLRFSELNSDSRNRRNWSCPTWSFNISSKEKPHLFTRCWLGSLLWEGEQRFKRWSIPGKNLCHILFSNSNLFCCHGPKGNVSYLSDRFHKTCTNPKCRLLYTSTSQQ